MAAAIWRQTHADIVTKWLVGALGAATVGVLSASATVAIAWPWRLSFQPLVPSVADGLTPDAIASSVLIETLVVAFYTVGLVY